MYQFRALERKKPASTEEADAGFEEASGN